MAEIVSAVEAILQDIMKFVNFDLQREFRAIRALQRNICNLGIAYLEASFQIYDRGTSARWRTNNWLEIAF